jgi:hypothetical protein
MAASRKNNKYSAPGLSSEVIFIGPCPVDRIGWLVSLRTRPAFGVCIPFNKRLQAIPVSIFNFALRIRHTKLTTPMWFSAARLPILDSLRFMCPGSRKCPEAGALLRPRSWHRNCGYSTHSALFRWRDNRGVAGQPEANISLNLASYPLMIRPGRPHDRVKILSIRSMGVHS